MAIHRHAPDFRPWVEQVAGLIGDPVRRLRFLRAVAPVVQTGSGDPCRRPRSRLMALLLVTVAGALIFWLAHARAGF